METIILTVTPDGTVRCRWTEALPLYQLGWLEVQRATAIEFDNQAQAWCVLGPKGECMLCSPSREACLVWEQKFMNSQLENS